MPPLVIVYLMLHTVFSFYSCCDTGGCKEKVSVWFNLRNNNSVQRIKCMVIARKVDFFVY